MLYWEEVAALTVKKQEVLTIVNGFHVTPKDCFLIEQQLKCEKKNIYIYFAGKTSYGTLR